MKTTKLILSFLRTAVASAALLASTAGAQTIANPSFEADNFTVFPGYISGNGSITGWSGTPADRVGLNPAAGTPFANNGAIPNGTKVAFIQSSTSGPSVLSTTISNLVAGQLYQVNFRVNARTNNPAQTPWLKVGIDNQLVLSLSTMGTIGGTTTPYRFASCIFTAAAPTAALSLTNDATGDTTILVDDFTINAYTNGWSFAAWTGDATSGVDSTKNFTHAYNFGGGAAPDTTINGVTFKGLVGPNPIVANEFGISGLGSQFTSDEVNNITTGGSAAMAKRFIYGGNSGAFYIGNLVPGLEYVATFYSVGWETNFRGQTFTYQSDRISVNQDHFGDNNGIRISYRYVAPASGAISLQQTPFLPANSLHLYGFANYEVNTQTNPVIGLQPRSQVTTPGSTATFGITAGGQRPLAFQWLKNGTLLPLETNRFLTISNITALNLGDYSVVVTNNNGAVTSSLASLTFGTIANPSFEADIFHAFPGYVSNNKPISGWNSTTTNRVGVSYADWLSPFANNGTMPNGSQVGFIQSTAANWLSTVLNGLTPGQKYTLTFRCNARDGQVPQCHAAIDNQTVVDFRVGSMGTTNAYKYVAFDFTPTTSSPTLSFTNDNTGDTTVLFDDFQIAPSTSKWSYRAWNSDADSGISSTNNYTHAVAFGNLGTTIDSVINGVIFKAAPGANPAGPRFTTAGFPSVFNGDSNVITGTLGGSSNLMRDFIYGGVPQSITLTGLVPNVEYLFTVYSVGWADTAPAKAFGRAATFSVGNDRMTINQNHYGQDNGIQVSYRYVADASGAITLRWDATHNNGGTPSTIHTYGFSNYELTSTNAPSFYAQPQGTTVAGGNNVTLSAVVGGQQPMTLQWLKDGVALDGATNSTLTLSNVNGGNTGSYTLMISNVNGVTVSAPAIVEVGLAMANPSFEADTFATFPGYVSGNFPITGWFGSEATGMGLNPVSDGRSPFANSGVIPNGIKAAFIQTNGGYISQVVTGMVVGKTYYLKFWESARVGYVAPDLTVSLGGNTVVPQHTVSSNGYLRVTSAPFLATMTSAELRFTKLGGPAPGDSTLVLDNVAVLELPPTAPTFLTQPQSMYVAQGSTNSLSAIVQGTMPIAYQWQRNGTDIPSPNDGTLPFSPITLGDAGNYIVIASNSLGSSTSSVAVVRVGLRIPELFNTGVTTNGLINGNDVDPHYKMIVSADPAFPGPDALGMLDQYPIDGSHYFNNGPLSRWIVPSPNNIGYPGNQPGTYVYRTTFVLDTLDPATALIKGKWAMDNTGVDIVLNGTSLGITNLYGFYAFLPFTITNGFVLGQNVLDFVISNSPPTGPTGLRVEMDGIAQPLPPTPLTFVQQPANILVQEGDVATLSALAVGSGPITYQWLYEGFEVFGETNRTITFNPVLQLDHEGRYSVRADNGLGPITSTQALMTVNIKPTPSDDSIACALNTAVSVPAFKLLLNDFDQDGDALSVVSVSATSTNGGTVSLSGGRVTYTPPTGYSGADRFTYTLGDSRNGRVAGYVNVTVGATNFLSVTTPAALQPNGHFTISYSGVPNYWYSIERSTNVLGPWEVLGNVLSDGNGAFQVDDPNTPAAPQRFYRTIYP